VRWLLKRWSYVCCVCVCLYVCVGAKNDSLKFKVFMGQVLLDCCMVKKGLHNQRHIKSSLPFFSTFVKTGCVRKNLYILLHTVQTQ
jgi:hypothetical protein